MRGAALIPWWHAPKQSLAKASRRRAALDGHRSVGLMQEQRTPECLPSQRCRKLKVMGHLHVRRFPGVARIYLLFTE